MLPLLIRTLPLLCLAALAVAQDQPEPPPVAELVDRARALPPEALADVFLRLLEQNRITDAKLRREMLDDVWLASGAIQDEAPSMGLVPVIGAGSETGRRQLVAGLRLERLTVRARVLRQLLRAEPHTARELFMQIPPFTFPEADCEAEVLPDVSEYYSVAEAVFERGFTDEQRREKRHLRHLEDTVHRIGSPVELAPAAGLLAAVKLAPEERAEAATVLAVKLGGLEGGNRAFFLAVRRLRLIPAVRNLVGLLETGSPAASSLALALRSFLAAHLAAPRCAGIAELEDHYKAFREDSDRLAVLREDSNIQINIREEISDEFNSLVLPPLVAHGYPVDPLPLLIPPRELIEHRSAAAREESRESEWASRFRALRASKPDSSGPSSEWRQGFLDALDLAGKPADGEVSTLEAFLEQTGRLSALLDLAPEAGLAGAAAARVIGHLSGHEAQRAHPAHWLQAVKNLALQGRPLTAGARADVEKRLASGWSIPGVSPVAAEAIRTAMTRAGHPVISFYAWLEQAYPEKRESWR